MYVTWLDKYHKKEKRLNYVLEHSAGGRKRNDPQMNHKGVSVCVCVCAAVWLGRSVLHVFSFVRLLATRTGWERTV